MSEADRDFTDFVRLMIIDLGDLNDDYPIHYIEMAYETPQLMRQPTRETSDISTTLYIITLGPFGRYGTVVP